MKLVLARFVSYAVGGGVENAQAGRSVGKEIGLIELNEGVRGAVAGVIKHWISTLR